MIIHSSASLAPIKEATLQSLSDNPKAGDAGHVEDHARIAVALSSLPIPFGELGYKAFYKSDGEWVKYSIKQDLTAGTSVPADWSDVVAEAGFGMILFTDDESVGDGVTDYQSDPFTGDTLVTCLYAGFIGVTRAFADLTGRVADMSTRISALEAG